MDRQLDNAQGPSQPLTAESGLLCRSTVGCWKMRLRGRGAVYCGLWLCDGCAAPTHRPQAPLPFIVRPAGAALTPEGAVHRLPGRASYGGGVSLQMAVAVLASQGRYLAANLQEALLLWYPGGRLAWVSAGSGDKCAPEGSQPRPSCYSAWEFRHALTQLMATVLPAT